MNAAPHSSRSLVFMFAKASLRSSGFCPMHGYCPFSAREIASVLISSIVRSLPGGGGCCAKLTLAAKTDKHSNATPTNLRRRRWDTLCIWPAPRGIHTREWHSFVEMFFLLLKHERFRS